MTPAELEFLAEETSTVTIVPLVRMDRLALIREEAGPLRPQIRCQVPLWLARALRQSGLCRIVPPDWFNAGTCLV